jgi:predicted amino acid dehydrogenase
VELESLALNWKDAIAQPMEHAIEVAGTRAESALGELSHAATVLYPQLITRVEQLGLEIERSISSAGGARGQIELATESTLQLRKTLDLLSGSMKDNTSKMQELVQALSRAGRPGGPSPGPPVPPRPRPRGLFARIFGG